MIFLENEKPDEWNMCIDCGHVVQANGKNAMKDAAVKLEMHKRVCPKRPFSPGYGEDVKE